MWGGGEGGMSQQQGGVGFFVVFPEKGVFLRRRAKSRGLDWTVLLD